MTDHSLHPRLALAERIADGTIHVLGVGLAVIGAASLLVLALVRLDGAPVVALSVYGGTLILGFAASALYHMAPWEGARPILRRIDHAAIYLVIAATYTPIVALIGGYFAWSLLAFVWALALIGAAVKLVFWRDPGRLGPLLYMGLGWLSLLLVWPMVQTFPPAVAVLVAAGGILISAGVVFFSWEGLRFAVAIWHGFVLAGSACFFAAISLGLMAWAEP
ncbi:MAG: hemolysin III family protein [Rubellimicrobium sp.]|nr:hemolysin III family protein [Rubellimicrobium sp.]